MLVIHFEDKTSRSVSVDELTKACDLAHVLADLQGAAHDRSWSVVEVLARFQLGKHVTLIFGWFGIDLVVLL